MSTVSGKVQTVSPLTLTASVLTSSVRTVTRLSVLLLQEHRDMTAAPAMADRAVVMCFMVISILSEISQSFERNGVGVHICSDGYG